MSALSEHTRSLQWSSSILIPWSFTLSPHSSLPWRSLWTSGVLTRLPPEERSDFFFFLIPRYGLVSVWVCREVKKSVFCQPRTLPSYWLSLKLQPDIPNQTSACSSGSSLNNCLLRLDESQNKGCFCLVAFLCMKHLSWFSFPYGCWWVLCCRTCFMGSALYWQLSFLPFRSS